MTPHDDLSILLRRARPAALRGRAGDLSAVRVLARVAASERGILRPPVRRSGRRRVAAVVAAGATAALLVGLFALPGRGDARRDVAPAAYVAVAAPPMRPSPSEVSALHLARAERREGDAVDSLRAFARAGGPRGADDAARVAALCDDPALVEVAAGLLAAMPGDAGPVALANALHTAMRERSATAPLLVDALAGAARAGRPAAFAGLRQATDARCEPAAVALLHLAGAGELSRILWAWPHHVPEVVAAVVTGTRDLSEAVLRRVERGEEAALALAAAARLPGLADALRTAVIDPSRAEAAVAGLATLPGDASVATLARALDGPARDAARVALVARAVSAAPVLEAAAHRGAGDASANPYLDALVVLGDAGVSSLVSLASRPALSVRAVRALASSVAPSAAPALATLAAPPTGRRSGAARLAQEALASRDEPRGAPASRPAPRPAVSPRLRPI